MTPEDAAFRERMDMIVRRARAEAVTPGRFACAVGPEGPLRDGAATELVHLNDLITERENALV
jgi:hypothetical protein